MLLSAAAQFDAQYTSKSSAAKHASKRHTVYEHDVNYEATEIDDAVFYDIDSDLNTIQAYNIVPKNKAFKCQSPWPLYGEQWWWYNGTQ